MNFTTFDKKSEFKMEMGFYQGDSFNNKEVINKRFCFILIENGSGILKINNKEVPFISPVIFCINENETIEINKNNNLEIKCIFFHPSVINSFLDFHAIRNLPEDAPTTIIQDAYWNIYFVERTNNYIGRIAIGPKSFRRFNELFSAFANESINQNRPNWPCRSRSYLMESLYLIDSVYYENQECNIEQINNQNDDEINQILLYLYNNYNKKITVTELTKIFNMNRTTLSKKFKDVVGESIITYLNKVRINMAAIMLRDTELPIAEIMDRVGFVDATHFLRTFKKYIKFTPKEYRNKFCWML